MGCNFDRKLYGAYPSPFVQHERENAFNIAPRHGPDNVALMMQGFQGMTPNHVPGASTARSYQQPSQQPYASPYQPAAAGAPTNSNYGVYSYANGPAVTSQPPTEYAPVPANIQVTGQYGMQSSPRARGPPTGLLVSPIMTDHMQHHAMGLAGDQTVGSGGSSLTSPLGPSRSPGALSAKVRNQDSLETFITGLAGGPQAKGKETDFDLVYGARHAGKATVSHITQEVNGLQGPTNALSSMPHMRTSRRGHRSQLESDPDGGYMPTAIARSQDASSGIRVYGGQMPAAARDNLQVSPTGLTGEQATPAYGRAYVAAAPAKLGNISHHAAGLSHGAVDGGYPVIRAGPYANLSTQSQLTSKAAGLTECGEPPDKRGPHAGLASKSQMQAGEGGLGGSEPVRVWNNPHAGKGQASQLTYSSGTMTILPLAKPEVIRPRAVDGWTTTYDDTYTTVQASKHQAMRQEAEQRPYRF